MTTKKTTIAPAHELEESSAKTKIAGNFKKKKKKIKIAKLGEMKLRFGCAKKTAFDTWFDCCRHRMQYLFRSQITAL